MMSANQDMLKDELIQMLGNTSGFQIDAVQTCKPVLNQRVMACPDPADQAYSMENGTSYLFIVYNPSVFDRHITQLRFKHPRISI